MSDLVICKFRKSMVINQIKPIRSPKFPCFCLPYECLPRITVWLLSSWILAHDTVPWHLKYRTSSFECLVSNESRVKRGHYDHEHSKNWGSNEQQGTEIINKRSFGEIRYIIQLLVQEWKYSPEYRLKLSKFGALLSNLPEVSHLHASWKGWRGYCCYTQYFTAERNMGITMQIRQFRQPIKK